VFLAIYLDSIQSTPPPPAPVPHRTSSLAEPASADVQAALKDIRTTLKRTKTLTTPYEKSISDKNESPISVSPVWIPR
jgi:amyloid beta A4 precursor protein-binding family A member 1